MALLFLSAAVIFLAIGAIRQWCINVYFIEMFKIQQKEIENLQDSLWAELREVRK